MHIYAYIWYAHIYKTIRIRSTIDIYSYVHAHTVNHKILLMKMYKYGIRGVVLSWFERYLSDRKQYVSIYNHKSEPRHITRGVPHDSILGSLLFLLYVNGMSNVPSVLLTILFAGDTNLFVSGKNLDHLIDVMNDELCKVAFVKCEKY